MPMTYSAAGEPPFFLYCNHCRWDSAEIGITFEKPTGLAGASLICRPFLLEANYIFDTAQLQKYEDSAPDALEFDRLKDHFEPFLRASSFSSSIAVNAAHPGSAAHSHHLHSTSITAAASAALARDIPGVAKYTPMSRTVSGRAHRDRTVNRDEMPEYKSRVDIISVGAGDFEVDYMRKLRNIQTVGNVEQRWGISWAGSLQTKLVALYIVQSRCWHFLRDLRPLRIPLHCKRSKRCPSCTHILIKPEQKAQSVRYKIKLVAANYLPAINAILPNFQKPTVTSDAAKRTLMKVSPQSIDDSTIPPGLVAGKTYPFHLALTNPLYDPIQVRLSVQRVHVTTGESSEKARRPPFAISLPTSPFHIAAFAEAWEYEDDDDMQVDNDDHETGMKNRDKDARAKTKNIGVLERRANVTLIGGEVIIGKEACGSVKVSLVPWFSFPTRSYLLVSLTCWWRIPIDLMILRPLISTATCQKPRKCQKLRRSDFIRSSILVLSYQGKKRAVSSVTW